MSDEPALDAHFLPLTLPSYVRVRPSPEMPRSERGFCIAAPRRVQAGPLARIPVCAAAIVEDTEVPFEGSLWNSVVAIAVDIQSNRAWAGVLADEGIVGGEPLTPESIGTPDAAAAKGPPAAGAPADPNAGRIPADAPMVSLDPGMREYGNFDLRPLLDLPPTPASYWIHLTFGALQSNAVRIDVVPEIGEE